VRYHTCYGIVHGPRIHEAALADAAGYMLRVNAGAYSFEAANVRHEHETTCGRRCAAARQGH
jgi:5-methyltetrahydropteroyltriglutamate--homocysteine methyltransferase